MRMKAPKSIWLRTSAFLGLACACVVTFNSRALIQIPRSHSTSPESLSRAELVDASQTEEALYQNDTDRTDDNSNDPNVLGTRNSSLRDPAALNDQRNDDDQTRKSGIRSKGNTTSTTSDSSNSVEATDAGSVSASLHGSARFKWNIPSPMSDIVHFKNGTEMSQRLRTHPYDRPHVLFAHVTPLRDVGYDLHIYSSGLNLGILDRNFIAKGCLVGDDVYEARYAQKDITICTIPEPIHKGQKVSVVLEKDAELSKALEGPVTLNHGYNVTLEKGDVNKLPASASVHFHDHMNKEKLMSIQSWETLRSVEKTSKEHMHEGPRYEICLATQMKMYPHLLPDWVDYHRRIGVDKIIILENNSPTGFAHLFPNRDDVEILHWPFRRSQTQCFSFLLHAARARCEWMVIMDADEYVMLGIGKDKSLAGKKPLKLYIDKKRDSFNLIEFRFLIMGNSGHFNIPKVPIPEAYTHLSTRANPQHGKVLAQMNIDWTSHGVHWARPDGRMRSSRTPEDFNKYPVSIDDDPSLVHFRFRSYEDRMLREKYESPNMFDSRKPGPVRVVSSLRVAELSKSFNSSVDNTLRYTHFRNIWREVTKKATLEDQTLVRIFKGKRCTTTCKQPISDLICEKEHCAAVTAASR